jgi:hypothetical protein
MDHVGVHDKCTPHDADLTVPAVDRSGHVRIFALIPRERAKLDAGVVD